MGKGLSMGTATSAKHKRVDIRRNDTVKVMTGRDRGKEGRVLRVLPDEGKVLVEHVMTVKKHVRPNPQRNIKGGIAEQERAIPLSNVALVCGTCGPVRVGHEGAGRPQGACVQEVRSAAGEIASSFEPRATSERRREVVSGWYELGI
jgi:large subunit ribosomal protein L24